MQRHKSTTNTIKKTIDNYSSRVLNYGWTQMVHQSTREGNNLTQSVCLSMEGLPQLGPCPRWVYPHPSWQGGPLILPNREVPHSSQWGTPSFPNGGTLTLSYGGYSHPSQWGYPIKSHFFDRLCMPRAVRLLRHEDFLVICIMLQLHVYTDLSNELWLMPRKVMRYRRSHGWKGYCLNA